MKAGKAVATTDGGLFPEVDIYEFQSVERPPASYGPNSAAVVAALERVRALDRTGIGRVASAWSLGGGGDPEADRNRAVLEAAVTSAADTPELRESVRAAFLDGELAALLACNPVMFELEHWWHSYPHEMEVAGYVAAATVVQDRLTPSELDLVRCPFEALDGGFPAGVFGPNHDLVMAVIEAVSRIDHDQAGRIIDAWTRKPAGDLTRFGYPGPLHSELGRDGWMPERKGRRHHAWIELMLLTGPREMAARRFEWAVRSAPTSRARLGNNHEREALFEGAIKAAVAAAMFADLAPARLIAELDEAWRSRDHAVAPSGWWEREGRHRAALAVESAPRRIARRRFPTDGPR
jgi:hypothetical protein